MRILVTGFDRFGKEKNNPSEWVVRNLPEQDKGRELIRVVLPTSYRKAEARLLQLLRREKPDAVVCLGLAAKRKPICIEMVALNINHADLRDNTKQVRLRRRIDPRGSWVLEGTLPVDPILRALKRKKIPAAVSYHAGTYVCNHVFYTLLKARPRGPAGFVHIPHPRRGLSRRRLLEGIQTLIRTLGGNKGPRRRSQR